MDRSATCVPTQWTAKSGFEGARPESQMTAKSGTALTAKLAARRKGPSRERKQVCRMAAAQATSLASASSPAGESILSWPLRDSWKLLPVTLTFSQR